VIPYGTLPDGRQAHIFTLVNTHGLRARLTDWGATLLSVETPDHLGNSADITLGSDSLHGWLANPYYFGATIGRFGNRIRSGKFSLDGKSHTLATNNAPANIPCHLHGGINGFDKVLWTGVQSRDSVTFTYLSPHGDEGYPGTLSIRITYTLTADNDLIWQAVATTDAPTILNLVHHSYWNLSGDPTRTILDHLVELHADSFLPTDAGMIPTGEIAPVVGTPMDFNTATPIGQRIDADFQPLHLASGYDHCWLIRGAPGTLRPAARVTCPHSGRVLEILTDQPGLHLYTGNFINGTFLGKNGVFYPRRSGLCLETEGYPDAPNQPSFPSCILRPGETYRHTLVHRFSAE
jgi:aldose 1-epimerase